MCSIHSAAGEPPWPGWLGTYTLKVLARRSWNGSHRPAPPAPCRNRRAGPLPSWSMWIGVPRIESSRDAGISADEEAAVRRQPLPGEERAVVAGEEECGGSDLPGVTGAPERRTGDHRRPDQRRHRLGHRRVDVARADRVDPDPTGCDVPRHGAREGEDPTLRRRVVRRRLEPHEGRNARQIDDRAPVPLGRQTNSFAGTEEGPVEMHGEHPSPRFVGEVLGDVEVGLRALPAHHLHDPRLGFPAYPRAVVAGADGDARVVHEDIERAELALDGREHRFDLGALRHVGLDRAAAGRPLHLRHGLLGHVEAHVVDDDARALLREEQRNRAPESGRQWSRKVLTSHDDPVRAVAAGVATVLADGHLEPRHFTRVVHATTLFTNALIERKGAVTGLITTAGFGDTLEIGRERKFELYDLNIAKPEPLVPRNLRREVVERVKADGSVRQPLHREQLLASVERLAAAGVASIAVVFLHAYANPRHEAEAVQLIAERQPKVFVTASHEVAPEIREFERA